jgi:signal transduction histidine kinase
MFVGFQSHGQEQKPTSVTKRIQEYEQEIAEGKVDEVKMLKNYTDLISLYSPIDFKKAVYYFHQAVAYAKEKPHLEHLGYEETFWRRLSECYFDLGKIDSAFYCIEQSIELAGKKGLDYEQCANYQVLGAVYFHRHEYDKALDAYLKALELNEKDKAQKLAEKKNVHNNLGIEASTYGYIAGIYRKMFNYDKAIDYLLRAKKIMDDNPTDRIAYIYFQIELHGALAEMYLITGQSEKALPLLNSSYKLAVDKELLPEVVFGLCRLSNFYRTERGNFNQALAFAKEALQISEKTTMPHLVSNAERSMMKAYFSLKNYQSACHFAERALSRTIDDDWENLQDVYGYLIMVHSLLGNASQSEVYLKKYNEAVAKISDENLHNSLQELEVKYEVAQNELKHQAEIERQNAEASRRKTENTILLAGLFIAVLLVAMLVIIVTNSRRRNRTLTETNATKDKFFSIISHDLKNPAVTQCEALQLLLDNADRWDTATLTRYYQKLLASAKKQLNLLYSLLDWAQVQAGRMPYNPVVFDLTAALKKTDAGIIQNMANSKGVIFDMQIPDTALVTGDCDMLTTTIRNLLANAVKFTPKGGNVTLKVQAPLNPPEGGKKTPIYTISVTDTGTGMTSEQVQNIFRLDVRQSRKGTVGEEGTGLGLIVCKELVEKHGSTLNVDSTERMGSRFWFEI